jgi:hypothetical protein
MVTAKRQSPEVIALDLSGRSLNITQREAEQLLWALTRLANREVDAPNPILSAATSQVQRNGDDPFAIEPELKPPPPYTAPTSKSGLPEIDGEPAGGYEDPGRKVLEEEIF